MIDGVAELAEILLGLTRAQGMAVVEAYLDAVEARDAELEARAAQRERLRRHLEQWDKEAESDGS